MAHDDDMAARAAAEHAAGMLPGAVYIAACCPVDRAKLPQLGVPLPPEYDGAVHMPCRACAQSVQVGPRTQLVMKLRSTVIMCYACAATYTADAGLVRHHNLGNPQDG